MSEADELRAAAAEFQVTSAAHDEARARLHAAVLAALGAGIRVSEVERVSGYKREHIRRLRLAATSR